MILKIVINKFWWSLSLANVEVEIVHIVLPLSLKRSCSSLRLFRLDITELPYYKISIEN